MSMNSILKIILILMLLACKTKRGNESHTDPILSQTTPVLQEYSASGNKYQKVTFSSTLDRDPTSLNRFKFCSQDDICVEEYSNSNIFSTEGLPAGIYSLTRSQCIADADTLAENCNETDHLSLLQEAYVSQGEKVILTRSLQIELSQNIYGLYRLYTKEPSLSICLNPEAQYEILQDPKAFFEGTLASVLTVIKPIEEVQVGAALTEGNDVKTPAVSPNTERKYGVRVLIWKSETMSQISKTPLFAIVGHASLEIYDLKDQKRESYLSWARGNDYEMDKSQWNISKSVELEPITQTQMEQYRTWFEASVFSPVFHGEEEIAKDQSTLEERVRKHFALEPKVDVLAYVESIRKGELDYNMRDLQGADKKDRVDFFAVQRDLEAFHFLATKSNRMQELAASLKETFFKSSTINMIEFGYLLPDFKKESSLGAQAFASQINEFKQLNDTYFKLNSGNLFYSLLDANCTWATRAGVSKIYPKIVLPKIVVPVNLPRYINAAERNMKTTKVKPFRRSLLRLADQEEQETCEGPVATGIVQEKDGFVANMQYIATKLAMIKL